jgi:purine-binding chemotaxis protein CheW
MSGVVPGVLSGELLLIMTVAGRRAALPAAMIGSVIEIDGIEPIPLARWPVAGLTTLRSRVLTVIDCRAALGLEAGDNAGREAVVVEVGGHGYALLVDEVRDVTPALSDPAPPRADPGATWAAALIGMVETAAGPVLVLDPVRLALGETSANRVAA